MKTAKRPASVGDEAIDVRPLTASTWDGLAALFSHGRRPTLVLVPVLPRPRTRLVELVGGRKP